MVQCSNKSDESQKWRSIDQGQVNELNVTESMNKSADKNILIVDKIKFNDARIKT